MYRLIYKGTLVLVKMQTTPMFLNWSNYLQRLPLIAVNCYDEIIAIDLTILQDKRIMNAFFRCNDAVKLLVKCVSLSMLREIRIFVFHECHLKIQV